MRKPKESKTRADIKIWAIKRKRQQVVIKVVIKCTILFTFDRMRRLKELIVGTCYERLNTQEHVTSSRGGLLS